MAIIERPTPALTTPAPVVVTPESSYGVFRRPVAHDRLAFVGVHDRPQEARDHVRRHGDVLLPPRWCRGAADPGPARRPDGTILSAEKYNQMFTMHATTMIFLFVMPMVAGFANYLLPLQIGARDVAFPRINAFGFWSLPVRRHLPQHVVVPRRRARRRLVHVRAELVGAVLADERRRLLGARAADRRSSPR